MTAPLLLVAVFNEAQRWALPEAEVDRLRAQLGSATRVEQVRSREALLERLDQAALLMGLPLSESQLAGRAGSLRFVQLVSPYAESLAPIDHVLRAGGRVAGTAPIRAVPVAEHAIGLLLTLTRRLDRATLAQASHRWASAEIAQETRDLAGATVGIVGLGEIGRAIADRLAPFGCDVIATRRMGDTTTTHTHTHDNTSATTTSPPPHTPIRLLPAEHLDELLGRSDVVILADHPPGRDRPILDRALFESLAPGALLINVASGTAFREAELLHALRRGRLAGAALDALDHRPLPPTSSLWNTPNVLVTPSVAAASPVAWRRAADVTLDNLARLTDGRPLRDEITAQPDARHPAAASP